MQALILVGGEATRLRPLTLNMPKAMVPVLNIPFLQHVISYLGGHGVEEIVLAQGHLPQPMVDYFQDGRRFNTRLVHAMESKPMGTGGAIKNAEKHLKGRFLVLNGDIFTDLDITAMLKFHRERRSIATIALTPVEDPTAYGLVETDKNGRVTRFLEKPSRDQVTTNMINAGTLIMEESVLKDIPADTKYSYERELFPKLLARGEPIYAYPSAAYWIDIGTPEKYLQVHKDLLSGKCKMPIPGQAENISLGQGCQIDPTARLTGPLVIGDDCRIGPAAQLSGPLAMGSGNKIGEGALLKDSVLWNNVEVGPKSNLRESLVANDCIIESSVSMEHAVIGDHITIARNTQLGPGSRLWPPSKP
jgi:mannose-1-phosphate guanylyltransferase